MRWMGVIIASFALAACGPSVPAERTAAVSAVSKTDREAAIEQWLMAEYAAAGEMSFQSSEFDLDGDGAPEVLVYVSGRRLCGSGGCRLLVLTQTEAGFTPVARTTVTRLPVGVLDTSTNGWRDLWVTVSGGDMPAGRRKLMFDGSAYPSDPTVPPAVRLHYGAAQALLEDGESTVF